MATAKPTTQSDNAILIQIYKEIQHGVEKVKRLQPYQRTITSTSDKIPRPISFPPDVFPPEVNQRIDTFARHALHYRVSEFSPHLKTIDIIFVVEDIDMSTALLEKYNHSVDMMLVWLTIADHYSPTKCIQPTLKIFVYHTLLEKRLPASPAEILREINVNTAFTKTCAKDAEIVVYRKEEWFKVFIHETFHAFGLDFSAAGAENREATAAIRRLFPVESDVNLYEAYTECWARIMNVLFCSYLRTDTEKQYLKTARQLLWRERAYSFAQAVKVLRYMGLDYSTLYEKTEEAQRRRDVQYKEGTNVLAYYILALVLFSDYQAFLAWCVKHNRPNLLAIDRSKVDALCAFVERQYDSQEMKEGIRCAEKKKKQREDTTVRMTTTECIL